MSFKTIAGRSDDVFSNDSLHFLKKKKSRKKLLNSPNYPVALIATNTWFKIYM